ncbi:MAG TPA: diacylglycerol kinase family protein [Candidatus Kapabacteria bacterium]|nr:diacylglycerol kinase family protein [Candidatus Kapabacteria bacterium]
MSNRDALFFIHNPQSSHGENVRDVRGLQRALDTLARFKTKEGDSRIVGDTKSAGYSWIETTGPLEGARIATNAAKDGVNTIVAVGGDGTVHEIINGIMSLPREVRPKLGILPTGSGNDFAYAAGIPNDLSKALDIVLRGHSTSIDIGTIEDDRGRSAFWDNSIGIGFDAKVSIQSKRFRALRGLPLYLVSTFLTLLRDHEVLDVDMTVDTHRFSEKLLMLTLGNGPREGGGFYTTPNSKIDDGNLEMLLVKPLSRFSMLMLLPKVLKGSHLKSNAVFERSFSSLRLRSKSPLAIHTDGEVFCTPKEGVRSITVELKRNALRVIR